MAHNSMRVAYILSDMIWDPDQPAKIRVEIFNIEFFDYNHDPDYPMNTSTMSFIFFSFLFFMLNYILIMIWKHEIKQKKRTIGIIYTQLPIDVVNSLRCFCSQNFNHFHCGKRWFNVTSKQMDCFVQLSNCLSVLYGSDDMEKLFRERGRERKNGN